MLRVATNGSFTMIRAGAAALAATLVVGAAAPVSARDQTGAIVGGLAAGVVGGVVGSALVNGANPPPPPPEYRPRRVLVEEPETVVVRERRGPICHYERRKEWLGDGEFTYRRVEVCE
ncbi:hypothetical protein [Methylobacterium sp. NEAU K]|uniref:hypothetical protein n=1 Tax=Methylobacterium sp. NEAU K TaxID=3064946 RepID=UPI002736C00F|nr:hypothetical protein [Methylobacterium sp. NEAU K]MDP4005296.1 hypothetical protein [Methylobacterium sp. NEAU K]